MSESRNIDTGGGNYIERVDGHYIQGNVTNNNLQGASIGNFANQVRDKASQNYTVVQPSLIEAAQEIQALLDRLSKTYPTETFAQKTRFVETALTHIQANPTLVQRLCSALDAGTLAAIGQLLNHPVAAFVIESIQDWKQTKPKSQTPPAKLVA